MNASARATALAAQSSWRERAVASYASRA